MTLLACFIYFVSLYSSLSPYSAEERRPFPPAGMPGKPASGTLCPSLFHSCVLNQVTKANASMALGQLEVACGHAIWCSQLSCQHLDAEFILTRTCQAQGIQVCLRKYICNMQLAQRYWLKETTYLCLHLKIFLKAFSHLYSFLVTWRQMWHGKNRV